MFRLAFLAACGIGLFAPLSSFAQNDDCKAVHGLVVEGTGQTDDTAEEMFQRIATHWGDAYADLSSSVSIVPSTNEGKYLQRTNRKKLKALSELIQKTPAAEMCSGDMVQFAFMKFALGQMSENVEVGPDELTSYRFGNLDLTARGNVEVEKRVTFTRASMKGSETASSPGFAGSFGEETKPAQQGFDQSSLLKKIRERKARCGDKADQVVMINLASHGSQECKFLMNFDQRLSPEDVRRQLIEPLAAEGVKVVLNFSNCYGGCFVDGLKDLKLPGGACFTSATRASTVAYGADGIVGGTYDETYPEYLRRLKNPLKAHLCATLWDPLNESQSKGIAPSRSRSGKRSLPNQRTETAAEVGRKLGFPGLASECTPPKSPNLYQLPGVPEEKLKALFGCPLVRKGFEQAGVGGDGDLFFGAITNPDSAPGLDSLRKLAADPAALSGLKSGCDIDLASYGGGTAAKKGTPPPEETGTSSDSRGTR
ncbi:MAG TPA: hypothetical protein PL182_04095 [Pseudobdellovibrionaceae bacterium]|nr:hypothetical protein [Pseudobdellovibrionaceae bacterium]